MNPIVVAGILPAGTAGPRTANVMAIEDSALYVVTQDKLESELYKMKPWMARLIHTLASRFRDVESERA